MSGAFAKRNASGAKGRCNGHSAFLMEVGNKSIFNFFKLFLMEQTGEIKNDAKLEKLSHHLSSSI